MDEKAAAIWLKIAQDLARVWQHSMRAKSRARLGEDDIRDFLIDLWLKKGGKGPEFEERNRGQLHNYTALHVGNGRDAMGGAHLLSEMGTAGGDDEATDEDRFGFLSCADDEFDDDTPQADDELGDAGASASEGGDLVDDAAKAGLREALDQRLEELSAIRDSGLSGALAEIFGTTDRRGRTFASEVRSEKMRALIVDAVRKRGMKPAEVKKLAAEIAAERRKTIARINAAGGDLSYSEIEAFEEMMGLVKPITTPAPTATTAKNHLFEAKRQRKSAQSMSKLPQQQSIPTQLELV